MASRPPEQDQIEIPPGGEDSHTPEVNIVADAATGCSDERQVGVAEHSASALRRATDRRRSIRWMSKVNAKFEAMVKIPLRRERVEKFISLRKPGHANELHSFPLSPKETQHNGIFYSVKDLLATGFLEGLPVSYVFKKHNVEIPGIIKGDKYACGCSLCNYKREISAREFEKHAEVTPSSQASNHIVLENGMTLHGIVKHLEEVPVELLREKMEMAIGRSIDPNQYATWINDKVTYKDKMNLIPPLR
uniref:Tify domain-containing protein n=1 Tax=Apostasia odorata TaxID=280455 RepID=A0A1S6YFZ7_9ASPA|nr:hypothetical protein [Apostasia odorata]